MRWAPDKVCEIYKTNKNPFCFSFPFRRCKMSGAERGRGALFARPISLIIIQILILLRVRCSLDPLGLLWPLALARPGRDYKVSQRSRKRKRLSLSSSSSIRVAVLSVRLYLPPARLPHQNTSRSLPPIRNASLKCRSFPDLFAVSVEQVDLECTIFCR